MSTMTKVKVATQVYSVYIKATPQAIWDAITKSEWTTKYGYACPAEYDLRPGGAYRARATEAMTACGAPEWVVDGEVLESDPPRKLVQTWRFLFEPAMVEEGFTRVTWKIDPGPGGITKLTVTHELDNAPMMAAQVGGEIENAGGGWSYVLSDLKTLLETGKNLEG